MPTPIEGPPLAALLADMGVTHVVSVPDSTIGPWHAAIAAHPRLRLVKVCREGEAWAVAGGLHLGGATPVVLIQCTGFFESGDSLRNIVHDWKLPIFSIIGYRSYLNQDTLPGDTCLVFTEPLATAWKLDWRLITDAGQLDEIRAQFVRCRSAGVAGAIVVGEGRA
ncbi:MAG TPA: thiamine pyrophosphate-binding protein [Gemmatimonadaceae bacterium]|nr:thiamine pyrophosphate-binding protein [Gemmatimonadaceae bacterium]